MSTTTTQRGPRGLLALVVVAVVLALLPARAARAAEPRSADELQAESLFVTYYNQARQNPTAWYDAATEAPQPALEAWTDIRAVARDWSDALAVADTLSHNPSFGDQLCCWQVAGENVGVISGVGSTQTVEQAVDRLVRAFMASDGHRANMTDPRFQQMGIGVTITDGGRLWVTVNFRALMAGETPPGERYDPATTTSMQPEPQARSYATACDGVTGGQFTDTDGNVHEAAIDCVAGRGIAQGKGDGRYDPAGTLRRGHIATFLVRTLEAAGVAVPTPTTDYFSDDNGSPHEANLNRLAALGALTGRQARPNATVTRGEMAVLVVDTLRAAGLLDTTATTDWFTDDDGSAAEEAINLVAELGIATGKGPGRFAADATLTRAQMATFLARTLDVALTA